MMWTLFAFGAAVAGTVAMGVALLFAREIRDQDLGTQSESEDVMTTEWIVPTLRDVDLSKLSIAELDLVELGLLRQLNMLATRGPERPHAELNADPKRVDLPQTGIVVRAKRGESWTVIDIAHLDTPSLCSWLRSRGGNFFTTSIVGYLLGHDGHEIAIAPANMGGGAKRGIEIAVVEPRPSESPRKEGPIRLVRVGVKYVLNGELRKADGEIVPFDERADAVRRLWEDVTQRFPDARARGEYFNEAGYRPITEPTREQLEPTLTPNTGEPTHEQLKPTLTLNITGEPTHKQLKRFGKRLDAALGEVATCEDLTEEERSDELAALHREVATCEDLTEERSDELAAPQQFGSSSNGPAQPAVESVRVAASAPTMEQAEQLERDVEAQFAAAVP